MIDIFSGFLVFVFIAMVIARVVAPKAMTWTVKSVAPLGVHHNKHVFEKLDEDKFDAIPMKEIAKEISDIEETIKFINNRYLTDRLVSRALRDQVSSKPVKEDFYFNYKPGRWLDLSSDTISEEKSLSEMRDLKAIRITGSDKTINVNREGVVSLDEFRKPRATA